MSRKSHMMSEIIGHVKVGQVSSPPFLTRERARARTTAPTLSSETQSIHDMITSTRTLACLAGTVALLLLGASHAAELDDNMMDAVNATMMNATMMNASMGNDTTNLDMMDMIGKDLEVSGNRATPATTPALR